MIFLFKWSHKSVTKLLSILYQKKILKISNITPYSSDNIDLFGVNHFL